jgi:hypothetical protein
MRLLFLLASLLVAAITVAQTQKASGVADFVSVDTPVFILDHVRVIDGTGTQAKEDQAIVIANGKIRFVGPDESAEIPPGAQRMDRSGYTVIPGLGCTTICITPTPTPCKLSTERLASRGCSLPRSLIRRHDSI